MTRYGRSGPIASKKQCFVAGWANKPAIGQMGLRPWCPVLVPQYWQKKAIFKGLGRVLAAGGSPGARRTVQSEASTCAARSGFGRYP
jgi:hypothetical protein